MAKNICQCPNPPGGQATCNEDQLAICRVVNGVAYTECIDVPSDVQSLSSTQGRNWILSQVFQVQRSPFQPVDDVETSILREGRYRVPGTTDVVSFKIPVGSLRDRPLGA
jgi:hypothetical protein